MKFITDREKAIWTFWALSAACVSGAILYGYYDHFWHSRDEGYFAHTAERLLQGEVLHRDIQTQHVGIIHFLHAFSFWLFGIDLLSLRIFPALTTWFQAGFVFYLMRARGPFAAFAATLAFSATAFPLFPSPTQHWTSLFLMVVLIGALVEWPGLGWRKVIFLGFLCGLIFGLRQPTGVFVSIAVSLICFSQKADTAHPGNAGLTARVLGPFFLLCFAGVLSVYVLSNFDLISMLLFAWAPILLLVRAALSIRLANRDVLIVAFCLCTGAVLPLLPIVIYHLVHGSLSHWVASSVDSALYLNSLSYVGAGSYASYLFGAPIYAFQMGTPSAVLMGLLWPMLLVSAPFVGVLLIRGSGSNRFSFRDWKALVVLVFYFLVAGHHPDRVYFYYILAPILFGLLIVARPETQHFASFLVASCALIFLYFQGAQPYERGWHGDFVGLRVRTGTQLGLERGSLNVTLWEAQHHQKLVQFIQLNSLPTDPILALPGNADFHFLAQRPNPLAAVMPVYSLYDDTTLAEAIDRLRRKPPRIVIHAPFLPYNTYWTNEVMRLVECDYKRAHEIDGFILYLLVSPNPFQDTTACAVGGQNPFVTTQPD